MNHPFVPRDPQQNDHEPTLTPLASSRRMEPMQRSWNFGGYGRSARDKDHVCNDGVRYSLTGKSTKKKKKREVGPCAPRTAS